MASKLPEHNKVHLDRHFLTKVLDDLSDRLFKWFGGRVNLVVHGGAVMVLHKRLMCRQYTRDVDYLHRAFEVEWKRKGVSDAGQRLNHCIAQTAEAFGLGLDWMNAHADVALPMALEYVPLPSLRHIVLTICSSNRNQLYDPIYTDAMQPNNLQLNTIYSSRGLQLIGVSWSWAVALKLVRYQKDDPQDIAAILKLGTQFKGLQWTRRMLEDWVLNMCSPMGYSRYSPEEIAKTRRKMQDAIQRAQAITWPSQVPAALPQYTTAHSMMVPDRPPTAHPSTQHDQARSLRPRTKSMSHLTRSVPTLSAASSMPNMHGMQVYPIPSRPSSGHSHPSQLAMVPVPVHQLPRGFVPYYVSPTPHQSASHRPSATRPMWISS